MKQFLFILAAVCLGFSAFAADAPKTDPKMQDMMKKMMEAGRPGAPHKVLADMSGKWTYVSKMWETADGAPQESKGTSTIKMVLGGRWMQHETKGKAMGMNFEGLGLTGYDNVKGKYESIWMDSMSTGAMIGEGSFDESTKTLSDSGEFSCPITSKTRKYRADWKIIDKNNMVYAMYAAGPEGGAEFKQMELTFKRTK